MKSYVAPELKFEKLTFFEKIACDDCWSNKEFVFDNPYTPRKIETYEISIKSKNCGNAESNSALHQVYGYLRVLGDSLYSVYASWYNDKPNTQMLGFSVSQS